MMQPVYLRYNAHTPIDPRVIAAAAGLRKGEK